MSQEHDETGSAAGEPPTEEGTTAGAETSPENEKYLEFADTIALDTSADELWEVISDPAVLTTCVPGAQSIERVSERTYTVDIERGVSKLTLSLSGEAEFVELNPPDFVVTSATAFDSKTGSEFEILAAMEMGETDDGQVALSYKAEVTYSGGAAGINKRVLRPIVKRDVDTYFDNVKQRVEGGDGT